MCGNERWLTAVGAAVQTEPEKNLKKDVKRSRCELESCKKARCANMLTLEHTWIL